MTTPFPILTSRSALEAVGTCPRFRFLAYDFARGAPVEHEVTRTGEPVGTLISHHIGGLAPKRRSIYFHTGGAVHEMVAELLRGRSLEAAVGTGHRYFWDVASKDGLDPEDDSKPAGVAQVVQDYSDMVPVLAKSIEMVTSSFSAFMSPEDMAHYCSPEELALYGDPAQSDKAIREEFTRRRNQWIAKEQWALAEGLVRAWDLKQRRKMLERYEVVEVEREGSFNLAAGERAVCQCGQYMEGDYHDNHTPVEMIPQKSPIIFQFRPDALLRDKLDGHLYVWSLKTKGQWRGELDEAQAKVDVQGLSEAVGWEANNPDQRIHGIQMTFLIKGKRQFDDRVGWKVTYSPLLRGWRSVDHGIIDSTSAWAWSWSIPDRSGKNKSGMSKLSAAKWKPFYSWEDYPGGVAEWFQALASGKIQPDAVEAFGDPIDGLFVEPPPYFRQPRDMESWLRQARAQETRLAEGFSRYQQAMEAEGWGSEAVEQVLDEEFPQNRRACVTWRKCAMYEACHNAQVRENPMASGIYELRQNHHEALED